GTLRVPWLRRHAERAYYICPASLPGATVTTPTQKPPLRRRLALEEFQQHPRDLLPPRLARMRPIRAKVLALPHQIVPLPSPHPIRPQIRTPEHYRRLHRPFGRVMVKLRFPLDLIE